MLINSKIHMPQCPSAVFFRMIPFAVIVSVFLEYLPLLQIGLVGGDDLNLFGGARAVRTLGDAMSYCCGMHGGGHFTPLAHLFNILRAKCFESSIQWWYLVNIILHLITVVLVARLGTILSGSKSWGWFSGAMFGISCVHWRTVGWATLSSYLLCGVFFAQALIDIFLFISSGRARFAGRFLLCQLFMMLSGTYGVEMPVVFLAIASCQLLMGSMKARRSSVVIIFFCSLLLSLLYVGVRHAVFSYSSIPTIDMVPIKGVMAVSSVAHIGKLITMAWFTQILKPMTGFCDVLVSFWFFCPIAVIGAILLLGPRPRVTSPEIGTWVLMIFLSLFMYSLPAIFRGGGEHIEQTAFASSIRFGYLPSLVASIAVMLIVRKFWPFTSGHSSRVTYLCVAMLFVAVLASNAITTQKRMNEMKRDSVNFEVRARSVVLALRSLLMAHSGPLFIYDGTYYDELSSFSGYDATISLTVGAYAPELRESRVKFLRGLAWATRGRTAPSFQYVDGNFRQDPRD